MDRGMGGMDRGMPQGIDRGMGQGMGQGMDRGGPGGGMDQRQRKGDKGGKGDFGGKGFGKDSKKGGGGGGFGGGCGGMDFGKGGCGMMDDGKGMGKGMPAGPPKDAKGLVRAAVSAQAVPGGRKDNDENTLFVGGLPDNMTNLEMYQMFSSFGPIAPRGATAMLDKESGKCTGIGFVNFMDPEAAAKATQALNYFALPDGTWLTVKKKGPPKSKGEGEGKGESKGKGKGKDGGGD